VIPIQQDQHNVQMISKYGRFSFEFWRPKRTLHLVAKNKAVGWLIKGSSCFIPFPAAVLRSIQAGCDVGVALLRTRNQSCFVSFHYTTKFSVGRLACSGFCYTVSSLVLFLAWLFLASFHNKINVVNCAGAVSSAIARTTIDWPSNPQVLQQLANKPYVPNFAGKLSH